MNIIEIPALFAFIDEYQITRPFENFVDHLSIPSSLKLTRLNKENIFFLSMVKPICIVTNEVYRIKIELPVAEFALFQEFGVFI